MGARHDQQPLLDDEGEVALPRHAAERGNSNSRRPSRATARVRTGRQRARPVGPPHAQWAKSTEVTSRPAARDWTKSSRRCVADAALGARTRKQATTRHFGHLAARDLAGQREDVGRSARRDRGAVGCRGAERFGPSKTRAWPDVLSDTRTKPAEGLATMIARLLERARAARAELRGTDPQPRASRRLRVARERRRVGSGVRLLGRDATTERASRRRTARRDAGVPTHARSAYAAFVEFGGSASDGDLRARRRRIRRASRTRADARLRLLETQMMNPQQGETRPTDGAWTQRQPPGAGGLRVAYSGPPYAHDEQD